MSDITKNILLQIDLDVDKVFVNKDKARKALAELKQEQVELNKQMQDLVKSGVTTGATFDNLTRLIDVNTAAIKIQNSELKNYDKQIQLNIQANKASEGSYEQLIRQQQLAQIELKNLEGSFQKNADGTIVITEANQAAADKVTILKEAIIEFDQKIKDGRTNVGNYESSLAKLTASMAASVFKLSSIEAAIKKLNDDFKGGGVSTENYNEQLKQLNTELAVTQNTCSSLEAEITTLNSSVENSTEPFVSLKQQLKSAREEAQIAQQQFEKGVISDEAFLSAQKKASDLDEKLKDFNKTINSLNPEAKFGAIVQAAGAIAGGISAGQSALALFGVESDNTQKLLLKVQAAANFATGLNQLAELGDAFKNLKLALGIVTVAKEAETASQIQNNVAKAEGIVVTQELAVVEKEAAASTGILKTAMEALQGPLGITILVAGAAVAALALLGGESEAEKLKRLTDNIERMNQRLEDQITLLKERGAEEISQTENQLALARARGESIQDIAALEQSLLDTRKKNLGDETAINKQQLANLERVQAKQKEAFDKTTDSYVKSKAIAEQGGAGGLLLGLFGSSEKEVKEVSDKFEKSSQEILKLREKIANDEKVQQAKLDADKQQKALELEEKLKLIHEQATQAKLSTITNDRQREVAIELETNNEKIRQLLKAEADNSELIAALRIQTAQKIKEIGLKYDLIELQERNKLKVLLTKEGSEERIQAEISAIKTEGEASLRAIIGTDQRAQTQRLIIQKETNDKIVKLEEERLQRMNDVAAANTNNILSVLNEQSDFYLQERFKSIALEELKEIDAATKSGQDISLIEAKYNKQRLDEQAKFNEAKINAENEIKNKLIEAQLVNTPKGTDQEASLKIQQEQIFFDEQLNNIKIAEDNKQKVAELSFKAQFALAGDSYDAQLQAVQDYEDQLKRITDGANADIELATANHNKNLLDITTQSTQAILSNVQDTVNQFLSIISDVSEIGANAERDRLASLEESGNARKELIQSQLDDLQTDDKKHLTEKEKREKELQKQLKEIDKETAENRKASEKKLADDKKKIQKEGALVEFSITTAKIIANTSEAVSKAIAASPLTFGQPFAAYALINGVLQEVALAAQTAKVLSLKTGGFTGGSDPNRPTTSLGPKSYEYHEDEYVTPHQVLRHPVGARLVRQLENIRLGNPVTIPSSGFAGGGYVNPSYAFATSQLSEKIYDSVDVQDSIVSAVKGIVVQASIEEINTVGNRVRIIESGASS